MRSLWSQHRITIALVAPLLAFFAIGSLLNHFWPYAAAPGPTAASATIDGPRYFGMVVARVLVISALLVGFARVYLDSFPLRANVDTSTSETSNWGVDAWGPIIGVIGAVVWIGLCQLGAESWLVSLAGFGDEVLGQRDAVNPFVLYPGRFERSWFLVFRFTLLVVVVPMAEELFLRGFLMRAVDSENWQDLPLTKIGATGLLMGTLYGVASHPSEALAAAAWFSLVTLMMVRTGKFWNCVLAHGMTNLLLGIYVCWTGNWQLW